MERADRGALTRVLYPILRGFWAQNPSSVGRYTTCFENRSAAASSAPPDGRQLAAADASEGAPRCPAILTGRPVAAEWNSLELLPAVATRCSPRPTRRIMVQSASRGFAAAQPRRWKSSVAAAKPLGVGMQQQDRVYSHLGGVQNALQVRQRSPGILCLQSGDNIDDGHHRRKGHDRQMEPSREQHGPCAATAPAALGSLSHGPALRLARRALQEHSGPLSNLQQPSGSRAAEEGVTAAASPTLTLSKAAPDLLAVPNKAGTQQTQPRALQESRRKDPSQTAPLAHADAVKLNKRLSRSNSFEKVAGIVDSRLSEFSDINTATALQRLANLKAPRGLRALQSLQSKLQAEAPHFSPRALAMSLHALARLGVHAPTVFEAASASAALRLTDFEPLGLADLAWASCAAKRPHGEVVEGVEAEVLRRIALRQPFCRSEPRGTLPRVSDCPSQGSDCPS